MLEHHRTTVERVTTRLAAHDETLAVLVGGSIAHGFESPASDVDIMIVVSDADAQRRLERGDVTYWETESATYPGGSVDGKYISAGFIRTVAERGSEPARFAFQGALVAWSRVPGLEALIEAAARYPIEAREEKLRKFYAQLEAWHWYCGEAFRLGNPYVMNQAVSNLVLFAGRLILAHNEVLYPYHKWFLRVLAGVKRQPAGLIGLIEDTIARRDREPIEALFQAVATFADWPGREGREGSWGARFMLDTELAWLDGRAAVGEL